MWVFLLPYIVCYTNIWENKLGVASSLETGSKRQQCKQSDNEKGISFNFLYRSVLLIQKTELKIVFQSSETDLPLVKN